MSQLQTHLGASSLHSILPFLPPYRRVHTEHSLMDYLLKLSLLRSVSRGRDPQHLVAFFQNSILAAEKSM